MDNRPIGVFDSGVGGLTTVRELQKLLPGEDIIYFGDTARVPYGTRSRQTICRYAMQIMRFLASSGVKAVVAACGTISTNLPVSDIESAFPGIPYVTVLGPAVEEAVRATKNRRIGVMATPASIRSGAYGEGIRRLMPDAEVTANPCPLLVPLVESGLTDFNNPITRLALQMYLEPVLEAGSDTLILGCTHYPLLFDIIADIAPGIALVDAGACAARGIRDALGRADMLSDRARGETVYYMTDTVEHFQSVAEKFLFSGIGGRYKHVEPDILEYE